MATLVDRSEPVLHLESVQFGWNKNDAPVLDIDTLTVNAGESVMIAGPSGSGKSTLLAIIAGVAVAQSGRVQVLGENLAGLSARKRDQLRADQMGIVFQQFNLVPYLSAQQNVLLPCQFSSQRRARIMQAGTTEQAEARRLLSALELDSPSIQNRVAAKLSLGQQQRVAVARALIGNPSLLIADEPTSALDEVARKRFLKLLFDQCAANNTALLFVTHDHRLADLFDRVLMLADINRVPVTSEAL